LKQTYFQNYQKQNLEVFKSRVKEAKCQDKNNRLQKMPQRRKEVINGEDWFLVNSQYGEVSRETNTAESTCSSSPGFSLK
jgi:hypothetical protein